MAPCTLGVVLAGGRSSRMGRDKALLETGGETFLCRAGRTLALATMGHVAISVAGTPARRIETDWPLIPDAPDLLDRGPIAGIVSAMRWAAAKGGYDRIVTLPVDMPFVASPSVAALIMPSQSASVAMTQGRPIPAFAVWPLCALGTIERLVRQDGVLALHSVQARLAVKRISLDAFEPSQFVNINTPEDFAAIAMQR